MILHDEVALAAVELELRQRMTQLAHTEYQKRPLDWIVDKLGVNRATLLWSDHPAYATHGWDGTPDPLYQVLAALAAGRRTIGVESGTTTGKTFLAACATLWFLACFENAIVVTVAPKGDQLKLHIWKEIGKLWPQFKAMFPQAEKNTLQIRMRPGDDAWAAVGFIAGVAADEVAGSATKAQGFHAEHMLIVFEETPGINPAIMEAFKQTCRAPHNLRLAVGNPDHRLDALHRFCTAPGATHIRISALDHPNIVRDDPSVVPGAVSAEGLAEARATDGEGSRMYESRVRGISPAQAAEALIRLEWCEEAAKRTEPAFRVGLKAKGVDVAQSENGDQGAIADWQGATLLGVRAFACPNATELGRNVWAEARRDKLRPEYIGVDAVGVGAATANALAELSENRVQNLMSGSSAVPHTARAPDGSRYDWAPDANVFSNLRGQMYWQMREDLRLGLVALPNDPALFLELTTPTFTTKNGKTIVEAKDEIRKRLGKSPDRADAVVYGNWVRPRQSLPLPEVRQTDAPERDESDVIMANVGPPGSMAWLPGEGW